MHSADVAKLHHSLHSFEIGSLAGRAIRGSHDANLERSEIGLVSLTLISEVISMGWQAGRP